MQLLSNLRRLSSMLAVPTTFVFIVSSGSLYELETMGCAARWNTKSGLIPIIFEVRESRFLMSRNLWSILSFRRRVSNNEGLVGISFEIPYTLAPRFKSQKLSQEPLKPVFP